MSEYDLYLQDDINNDNSLTQWFYFSVKNIQKNNILKLNILNLMKDDSLYSEGMKPFVYSLKHKQNTGIGWFWAGFNITYTPNDKTIRTSSKTVKEFNINIYFFLVRSWFRPVLCGLRWGHVQITKYFVF